MSCKCFIVPPHILEALAKRGSLNCKRALNDSNRILEKRNTTLNTLLQRQPEEGDGRRQVYDSGSQFAQRVLLVREEGGSPTEDKVVNDNYDLTGYVRRYFKDNFGYNSLDDHGMLLISNVHYGSDYNNAFWDGDEMTYGDGDGLEFLNFASAVDVVAHELMHGVTQFLANLEYRAQPGALNEHFSDVFATLIKQDFLGQSPGEADWLIGDSIVGRNFPGRAIRSIKAPGTASEFDRQPDHMDDYFSGASDNYGVHINSGIPNKAFYLSCIALGKVDCGIIWFETLKRLWRTANFQDMISTIVQTTKELENNGKVAMNASSVIEKSFTAVGLSIPEV